MLVGLSLSTSRAWSMQSSMVAGAPLTYSQWLKNAVNLMKVIELGADLVETNLSGAFLKSATLANARLSAATLDGLKLTGVIGWRELRSIGHAGIDSLRYAPAGPTTTRVFFARSETRS